MEQRMAAAEKEIAVLQAKVEDLTNQTGALTRAFDGLHELTTAVKLLAEKLQTIDTSVEKLQAKIEALESKPGKRWEAVVEKVLYTIVGAVVALVLSRIGL